jgi:anti-sigma factor (TIGR02949 family)
MTTPSLDCLTVVKELWDYLDGELDAARFEAIRDHLRACTGCHSHVEFARTFVDRVATVPVDELQLTVLRERVLTAMRAG